MKKIGNIILDDTHYPGEDLYSDGAVEDRLLELARECAPEDYNAAIARERDWAVMYHFARERENILSWYPFREGAKILEVGSGCGAVTGALSGNAREVTCIDLSMKRSTINALRRKEAGGVRICVGNFQDIEKDLDTDYDYATLIGVFEYSQGYIGGDRPYHDFLAAVMRHLRPGGALLLAIENKFGLKYWAGCAEDHVGRLFEGLEGYPGGAGVRTFTKPGLTRVLEECGCRDYRFYYPYPDYKFPSVIFSDERLPKEGELERNIRNFDRPRLVLMDEGKAYAQILEDGLFPLYSNSFFVEIRKPGGEGEKEGERVIYAKFSDGRSPRFALQTRIVRTEHGKFLCKSAECREGEEHVLHIARAREDLERQWGGQGPYLVNRCRLAGSRAMFEYLEGVTLEERLDGLLSRGKEEEAVREIREAVREILESGTEDFEATPEFRNVFGDVSLPWACKSPKVADVDLIFPNILIAPDGRRHVLDYEWTFDFPVPAEYIAYRALHYYLSSAPGRMEFARRHDFYGQFGMTEEKMRAYAEMERHFQVYISGGYASVGDLYHRMGKPAVPLGDLLEGLGKRRMQIYIDRGEGFSEEDSYFLENGPGAEVSQEVTIPEDAKGVWVDPALSACVLRGVRLAWEGGAPVRYHTTGFKIGEDGYLFDNSDPKIIIEEIPRGERRMRVSYRISVLEEPEARLLMEKLNWKRRLKKNR